MEIPKRNIKLNIKCKTLNVRKYFQIRVLFGLNKVKCITITYKLSSAYFIVFSLNFYFFPPLRQLLPRRRASSPTVVVVSSSSVSSSCSSSTPPC